MKIFFAVVILLFSITVSSQPEKKAAMQKADETQATSMLADIHAVSPALERYTRDRLIGELWKRPDLSPRDRSIVTLAALIARNQTVQMGYYINLALDNGVKPSEIAEIITHLAFYSGWENAMSAVVSAKDVFHRRGITPDQLPPAPLNCSLSTRLLRNSVRPASSRTSAQSLPAWCNTPRTSSLTIFGCAQV